MPKLAPTALALLLTLPLAGSSLAAPSAPLHLSQADAVDLDLQGRHQLEAGEFEAAIATYEQALSQAEVSDDPDAYEEAFLGLAKATLLAEDYPRAIALWEQLAAGLSPDDYGHVNATTSTNLALALYNTGQYAAAETRLREAIAAWETVRADSDDLDQVTLFEQQAHSYRLLQKALVAQGKIEDALVIAEASRGQALVEQLVQQYGRVSAAPPLSLNEIRQTAQQQNTTLVLYSLVGDEVRVLGTEANYPNTLYTWVVQPNGQIQFHATDLAAMDIDSLRHFVYRTRNEAVQRRSRGRSVSPTLPGETFSQQMYQLLIAPIAAHLPQDPQARVTLLPQGPLFLLPFPALRDLNGNYLIEHHTLVSAPSVQVLRLADEAGNDVAVAGQAPVIIGNPQMPTLPDQDVPLTNLPGAEAEAEAIAALFNTQPLLRGQATESSAILNAMTTAPIVHFATHGLLDLDSRLNAYGETVVDDQPTARDSNVFVNPGSVIVGDNVFIGGVPAEIALSREKVVRVDLPGALALTPALGSDGFLTSREIAQLDLAADLVVLSACDTGQGRITGDGVVGLARSFIAAGADTVVVSLWAIPDAPTADLMVAFYQQLAQHGDKAQALREAMLATQESYP
ncbi:MAG: CHAT domain-containing protein, partial [Spirulina sp. SIO3F2]|nr:CHAT domain-containing protein [Spirulina sp. SIO3F2]